MLMRQIQSEEGKKEFHFLFFARGTGSIMLLINKQKW